MINALGKLENISTLVFSAFLRACMLSSRYLLQTTSSEAARFCLREWTSGYTPRLDYLHVKAHLLQSFSLLRLRPYCHQVVPLWQIPVPARTRRLASEYSHQQRPRSVFGPESRSDVPCCRPFLSKLYNFVSGFGVSCTSLTARNEGRGRARYRRTNFREHRTRASTIERRRLGDSRLGTMSNHTLFLRVEMGAGLTQGWSS